jgi:hypothetical protein
MSYFCEKCNFSTPLIAKWNRHLDTNKHIINCCNEEEKEEKGEKREKEENTVVAFRCVLCSKNFDTKQNYQRHLGTKKHRIMFDEHTRTQEFESRMRNEEKNTEKNLEQKKLELEEKKLVLEEKKLVLEEKKLEFEEKKLSTLSSNTTINNIQNINNTMNVDNTVNNNFNLNIFLNEDCKDALNITDFINSISLTLADLEETARLGYTEGITKIIVDRIKEIGINKRPYHCTDLKREIVYIKDEDLWEKEQNDKPRMKKMISNIIHKNLEQLTDWKDAHPGCMDLADPKGEEYLQLMIEANGGSDRSRKEDKILKNIIGVANISE